MRKINLISVIIPVYNAQKYLAQCLDSVLANTWNELEVICVNDGSTDRSGAILQEYAQKDSRVVLIEQTNSGVSAARNAGLEQMRGDCVAFVDADDFIAPDFFESLARALTASDADIAVCGTLKCDDSFFDKFKQTYLSGEPAEYRDSSDQIISDSYLFSYMTGRIFAVSCLEGVRFPSSLSLGEDTAFNLQIYARHSSLKVVYATKNMYFYRIGHPDSLTNTYDFDQVIQRAEWCLTQYDGLDERGKTIYLDAIIKSFWAYRYLTMFTGGDRQKMKAIRKQCRQYAKELPLSLKTRLKYFLFTNIPQCYRLFRLLTDRTMFQWEKEQKKAAREQRKTHE